MGRLDQNLEIVFIEPHEVGLCRIQKDARAIVLLLECFVLDAALVEHLNVYLVDVAVTLFEAVHLVDEEADFGLVEDERGGVKQSLDGLTPVLGGKVRLPLVLLLASLLAGAGHSLSGLVCLIYTKFES